MLWILSGEATAKKPHGDYLNVVNNPYDSLSEYKASYDEFLTEAQDVVEQMKVMDDTGLLSFRFTISGPTVEMNEIDPEMFDAARQNFDKINKWISENASTFEAIAEKGAAYAYASAAKDYQEKYGVSRDDAVHSGLNEIQKHALTIGRNATNHYGVNPLTKAESTERFGEPGKFTYGPGPLEYSKFNVIA